MARWLDTFTERRPRLTVFGLLALFALLGEVVAIAPAGVALVLAIVIAGSWCWWLEQSTASAPTSVR